MQDISERLLDDVIAALKDIEAAPAETFTVAPHVPQWTGSGVCAVCGRLWLAERVHPILGRRAPGQPALDAEAEALYRLERQS